MREARSIEIRRGPGPAGPEPHAWTAQIVLVLLLGVVASTATRARCAAEAGQSRNPARDEQLLQAGKEAMTHGNYARAIASFQKLAEDAPDVAEVHANLGSVYYFAGQYDNAIRECRRALRLKPDLELTTYFLALSLAESGRCAEALPHLTGDYASVDDPRLKRMVGVDRARCAMSLGRADDAVKLVQSLTRAFPDDPDVLYLASHIYSDLSTRASERLLAADPDSYQAHRFNAEVLETEGKLDEAIAEYRKVLAIDPRLAGIHYEIGELILATVKGSAGYNRAEAEFESELKIDPWSAPSEYELGNLAWQSRQWKLAAQRFRHAVELDPAMAAAWAGLGKSLSSSGDFQHAAEALDRAVKLNPRDPDAHYRLAFALRHLGREKEAEQELALYRRAEQDQTNIATRIRQGMAGSQMQKAPPEH